MSSSVTLRSQPPKIGIQYPNRILSSRRPSQLYVEQLPEEAGDGLLRWAWRHCLDPWVVVRVGVDVVGDEPAVLRLDELESSYLDAVPAREVEVLADDRMVESVPQREQAPLRRLRRLPDRAGVGRAELEAAELGIGRDRVDELAAHDLGPSDARLRRTQVLLQERDAVRGHLEVRRAEVGVKLLVAGEQPNPEPLAALVVLADERRWQPAGGGGEPARPRNRDGPRHVEPRRAKRRVLLDLAHLEFDHAAA